ADYNCSSSSYPFETALSGIGTPLAYADESETSTEQKLKQKNVGSGDAEQNNCAEQAIKAGEDQ
ncbi:MAG: hypothetical protein WA326_13600, partial [Nitrososphaeraceae archaeon]